MIDIAEKRAPKRILQFCHGYDGPFLDCARQYAALFDGSGYKVTTVFLTGKKDAQVAEKCHSDEVIFMEYSSAAIRGLKLKAIRELRQIASKRDFSLCIAHRSKPTYIACLATSLPIIGIHHAFGDFERLGRKLFAHAFRQRLHLLAVSDAVRDDIRRCLRGWPQDRIQTLYNRIDVDSVRREQLPRDQARQALGLPESALVIGNVGRLHADKDQATLIRGFAKASPDFTQESLLIIMGQGKLDRDLKALASELGIADKVIFKGQVANARQYFNALDIFALTSDHEPFGMVLLEAMAAGVPIVVSDCGGAPEVVGQSGELFELGRAEALARSLVTLAQLDAMEVSKRRKEADLRLSCYFSDTAARERFWLLPGLDFLK